MSELKESRYDEILNLVLPEYSDYGAVTIKDALFKLLSLFWQYGEGLSTKRPLGNSDWQEQVIDAIDEAGLLDDNEDGYKVIGDCIRHLQNKL